MDHGQSFGGDDPNHATQYGINNMQTQQQQLPHHLLKQQQHPFVRWTAQPITSYQLVPMDGGACAAYQPVFAHQAQPQQQYQQRQQQPTLYAFAQNMAMPSMPQMPPMTPMSPITPMAPIGSGLSPVRRQPSFGDGSFYQPSPPQYQQYQGVPVQQQQQYYQLQPQPQQHQLQRSQSIPAMSSHGLFGSPEAPRAFHLSPIRRAPQPYSPNMVFATPQPAPARNHEIVADVFVDNPPAPATLSRLAARHASFMNHRPNKPKPLALSTSHLQPGPGGGGDGGDDSDAESLRSASQPVAHRRKPVGGASTVVVPIPPSVTPVGSDRGYDGGGSSYSTSPLGSEANARIRARMRVPFVPRTPKYLRTSSTSVKVGAAAAAATANDVSAVADVPTTSLDRLDGSLEQFLQDHIHSIESNYSDGKASEGADRKARHKGAYRLLSSSDEWCTTTDTDPIRSRHRHRVAETQAADEASTSGSVALCNCGMQQCCQCGLFISRPETHTCMGTGDPSLRLPSAMRSAD